MKPIRIDIPGRVFVDVSTLTHCVPRPNGIIRCLLALSRELRDRNADNLHFCAVRDGRFDAVELDDLFARFIEPEAPPRARSLPRRLASRLGLGRLRARWNKAQTPSRRINDFAPDDWMISLGGGWNSDTDLRAYRHLKSDHGSRIAFVLYDLIPILFPHFFRPHIPPMFTPWFTGMIPLADLAPAISERTKSDFVRYCGQQCLPVPPISMLRLGEDFRPLFAGGADWPTGLSEEASFVLSVGTLEVRKNHLLLYQVWRNLLQSYGHAAIPTLVLAGEPGWLTDDLLAHLRADPVVAGKIVHLDRVTDIQLARLYDACLFTMYPSHYEGWGLPVCESLNRGKVCIASDAGSIPEIAPELADTHDPLDFMECRRLVETYLFDPAHRRRREARIRAEHRPTLWSDTANQLLDSLTGNYSPPASSTKACRTCFADNKTLRSSR